MAILRRFFLHALLFAIISNTAAVTDVANYALRAAPNATKQPTYEVLRHASRSAAAALWEVVHQKYERLKHARLSWWGIVQLMALCGVIHRARFWTRRSGVQAEKANIRDAGSPGQVAASSDRRLGSSISSSSDADVTDPGLLKKYSRFKSYTTSNSTYQSIRTFYRPHPQADKLPSGPTPLPLLVFIHGIGGSLAQFNPLLTSLVNAAPCFGIDLPGCGRSAFTPTSWEAYTPIALAELLSIAISQQCAQNLNQGVILVGHSMGCSFSVLVAKALQQLEVLAIVGICPQATPPSDKQLATFDKLLLIPTPIFDIWRTWDRRGGPNSASVARFVGQEADIDVKRLQERFNTQSRTAVWRRMAWGALPSRERSHAPERGLPGLDIWASLKMPLFLVGGEGDKITKTDQIVKIGRALGKVDRPLTGQLAEQEPCVAVHDAHSNGKVKHISEDEQRKSTASNTEVTLIGSTDSPPSTIHSYTKKRQVLKTSILPSPASHALLYDPATHRTLAGLIHTFLYEHVDSRLSLGWQLQHLSTEGKWDVKNLAKWQAVPPVSEPIAGIFRAMKTLREIDETHSPDVFVRNWRGKIKAVIDISHESPVYDPKGLDEGGIEYHKFPTVSKIPPTPEEVQDFIKLVDRLRTSPSTDQSEDALIGVHCHYGFNRTGFFICCYLIEKEGYGVQRAIDLFAACRSPGIRHEHFLDQLFVRYCVGLKRAPTL